MFVENDRHAISAIERNLAQTGLSGRIRKQDVFDFLSHASTAEPHDLIFADPPYDKSKLGDAFTKLLLRNDRLPARLASDGIFVLEKRPARTPADDGLLGGRASQNLRRNRDDFLRCLQIATHQRRPSRE